MSVLTCSLRRGGSGMTSDPDADTRRLRGGRGATRISGVRTRIVRTVVTGVGVLLVALPRAQLSTPNVDPDQSRVLNQDLGVIDRLGGLFSDQPNPQNQQMYVLARQRLSDAATQVGLQKRAEGNTRTTLNTLLRSLGFTTVTITFADPAGG